LSTDLTVRVLGESVGKRVLIKLKGGRVIRGLLEGYDQHMNLLLEESEEIKEDGATEPLGVIILRGDNVVLISPPPLEGGAP
jgi:small nuclear ribonucleoprotein